MEELTTFDCGWKGYTRAVGVRGTIGVCHCGWRSPSGSVSQNRLDVAAHIQAPFDSERQAAQDEYDEMYPQGESR